MAVTAPTTSRRGLLGFLAVAPAALALPQVVPAPTPEDWRTKRPEDWTKVDYRDEARFQANRLRREVRSNPNLQGSLDWWERELGVIERGFA
jgi:hypothetical protein